MLFAMYNQNYQVKEDEVCEICDTNGGEENLIWVIGKKIRRKETTRKTKM
jgi:hypothetical protein